MNETVMQVILAMAAITEKAKKHPEVSADALLVIQQLENLGLLIGAIVNEQN